MAEPASTLPRAAEGTAAAAPAAGPRWVADGGVRTGTLLTLAPAAAPLAQLLRTAIDAEQVGAARLHLAADQPDVADAVDAIRAQTRLVITADPGTPAAALADQLGPSFVEILLDGDRSPPDLVAELARIALQHPAGASVSGRGAAALPVLLAALAVGLHIRVGTADAPSPVPVGDLLRHEHAPSTRDDIGLVARAAGLARIAGRPPIDIPTARALLGLS